MEAAGVELLNRIESREVTDFSMPRHKLEELNLTKHCTCIAHDQVHQIGERESSQPVERLNELSCWFLVRT